MIGITIDGSSAREAVDSIKSAEAQGVPVAWMTTAGAGLDALTIFAAAAMQTERIVLGASIIPTWPRHPIVAAQQAQVIEQIAPGRLILGVGPSNKPSMERLLGVEWRSPQKHLREYITILKSLLQDGSVDFTGSHFTARARIAAPMNVPIMAGSLRQATYRLCGEVADGAISWLTPWPHLQEACLPQLEAGAAAAGRKTPALVVHVPFCLSEDREAVRKVAREQLGFYAGSPSYVAMFAEAGFPELGGAWSDPLVDAVVASGSDEAVATRLATIIEEGASDIIAMPLHVDGSSQERAFAVVAEANRVAGD